MSIKYQIPHIPMLGKGSILLDQFDSSGNPTGVFKHLGNCTKFEIDVKDDIAELYQSINKNVTLIATAVKKRQPKLTITGTDFSSDHVAIAQMSAGKTTLATTATTFTAEVLISIAQTANCKGRYFKTANINVDPTASAPVLTQNSVTLAAGTDYVLLSPTQGIFYIPSTSTIDTTGTHAVTVTYHTLVGSFDQVAACTVPFVTGHIYFSPDPVDGQSIACDVWKVNLNPNGQLGLIADDYGNWSLDGNILDNTAATPNSPFYEYTFLPVGYA